MSTSIRLIPEPVRTRDHATIGVAYMGIGTSIDSEARIIYIFNLTDAQLMFSFDGINDHFPVVPASFVQLDVCWDKSSSEFFGLAVGERLYVRYFNLLDIPTKGSVYMTVFHGKDEPGA